MSVLVLPSVLICLSLPGCVDDSCLVYGWVRVSPHPSEWLCWSRRILLCWLGWAFCDQPSPCVGPHGDTVLK